MMPLFSPHPWKAFLSSGKEEFKMTKAYGKSGTRKDLEELLFSSRGMSDPFMTNSFDFSFLISPGMEISYFTRNFLRVFRHRNG